VLKWLIEVHYTPVIVGKSTSHVTVPGAKGLPTPVVVRQEFDAVSPETQAQCIDLRDKTSLLELRDWLGHANAVIGMDGGTLHLAGTTNVPIVYACTHIDPLDRPIVRYGERNWNVRHIAPRELECSGCQSHWTLMFKMDFRYCAYKDYKCTYQLHPDDFINALRELGL
jgi:ADP-heptose:LPS heptosyltransferase